MFEGKRKNKRTALSDVALQWLLNSNAFTQNPPHVAIVPVSVNEWLSQATKTVLYNKC